MELKDYETCELVEELKKREGVRSFIAKPYEQYDIGTEHGHSTHKSGPAIILEIID